MAKRKSRAESLIDEAVPETGFDVTVVGEMGWEEAAVPETGVDPAEPPAPKMTDPEWDPYVKSHFLPDEGDREGGVTTDGLRRVVELLLGDIVRVDTQVVEAPRQDNRNFATVAVGVSIAWNGDRDDVRVFCDAADVSPDNTDEAYARYPVASATTRAEGRAYRKALKLRRVLAVEEKTSVPVERSVSYETIQPYQFHSIDKTCRDLDIDAEGILRASRAAKNYKNLNLIPAQAAIEVLEGINTFLQDPTKIPAKFVGYKADWRSK